MPLFADIHSPIGLPIFLLQAIIVLVVTRVVGKCLKYVHQPAVVGEIIGGIILGPSLCGLSQTWTRTVFPPESVPQFALIANVGLILFMFFLGLEIDPSLMRKHLRTAAPVAVVGVLVPFLCGLGLSFWIYPAFSKPDVNQIGFCLFFSSTMSFTAFPVLASILQSSGLLAEPLGVLAFSSAAIADVVAWCVLAFATSMASSSNAVNGIYVTLLAVAHSIVMICIIRPALAGLVARFPGSSTDQINRAHVMVVLVILLCSAFFTEMIGIHAFFGAFIAGAIVPKASSLPHVLAPRIELIVVDFLLPLYFASSGMKLNLTMIDWSANGIGALIAIIVVACVSKFVPTLLITRWITGRSLRFCASVGVLMNCRGLVLVIALNIGIDLGILTPNLFGIMILMALFTTIITPPTFHHLYVKSLARPTSGPVEMASSSDPELEEKSPTVVGRSHPQEDTMFDKIGAIAEASRIGRQTYDDREQSQDEEAFGPGKNPSKFCFCVRAF